MKVERVQLGQRAQRLQRAIIKRTLMVLLVGILAFITACGSSTGSKDSKDSAGESKEPAPTAASGTDKQTTAPQSGEAADPFGKIDPPIEVTAVRAANPLKFEDGDTIENNGWTELYEKEFGIKLKYLWISDQFEQKMNVTMISGKLPDIMPVSGTQLKQLAEADKLADLTEALEKYGSKELKELFKKDGGIGLNSATFDGKLLALPWLGSYTDTAPLLWIRTDWLEKLKLPEPKTMDDVMKIAEAFANQDPDGNNKKDTYGLSANKTLFGDLFGLDGFFNSYHAYPNIWIKDASGQSVYGSIQPEVKTALAKLQEMYKSGLIDREFGVKDTDKVGQLANAGKIGLTYSVHWLPLYLQDGKNLDPKMEWKPYRLLSADDKLAQPKANYTISTYYAVRKGMEHPEAAVKMMNASLRVWDDKYPQSRLRINGDVEKWKYALIINANPTQNLEAYERVNEALSKNDESVLDHNTGEPNVYKAVKSYLEGDIKGWGYNGVFGAEGAQSIYADYKKNNSYKITEYIGAPTPAMVEKGATLAKMELETFTKIIMGEASIDSFDEFVVNWKKLGGDAITKEVEQSTVRN
ncbi:extracellular solute-binding protein [Paenibacillus eucommiae]|uniref:Aldouronate transport system substrate-binding protein n=1 Tax=Paenibacillus eucommiae TaxID=1355755 RepID=A0ABS4IU08_9BACL|nr:extracellular solute-binding protein [Paenibacillus eucommiae]MBP1991054.1 putative aldouronate transport system substrate-binding protein [Paenibacillus eucommiae]